MATELGTNQATSNQLPKQDFAQKVNDSGELGRILKYMEKDIPLFLQNFSILGQNTEQLKQFAEKIGKKEFFESILKGMENENIKKLIEKFEKQQTHKEERESLSEMMSKLNRFMAQASKENLQLTFSLQKELSKLSDKLDSENLSDENFKKEIQKFQSDFLKSSKDVKDLTDTQIDELNTISRTLSSILSQDKIDGVLQKETSRVIKEMSLAITEDISYQKSVGQLQKSVIDQRFKTMGRAREEEGTPFVQTAKSDAGAITKEILGVSSFFPKDIGAMFSNEGLAEKIAGFGVGAKSLWQATPRLGLKKIHPFFGERKSAEERKIFRELEFAQLEERKDKEKREFRAKVEADFYKKKEEPSLYQMAETSYRQRKIGKEDLKRKETEQRPWDKIYEAYETANVGKIQWAREQEEILLEKEEQRLKQIPEDQQPKIEADFSKEITETNASTTANVASQQISRSESKFTNDILINVIAIKEILLGTYKGGGQAEAILGNATEEQKEIVEKQIETETEQTKIAKEQVRLLKDVTNPFIELIKDRKEEKFREKEEKKSEEEGMFEKILGMTGLAPLGGIFKGGAAGAAAIGVIKKMGLIGLVGYMLVGDEIGAIVDKPFDLSTWGNLFTSSKSTEKAINIFENMLGGYQLPENIKNAIIRSGDLGIFLFLAALITKNPTIFGAAVAHIGISNFIKGGIAQMQKSKELEVKAKDFVTQRKDESNEAFLKRKQTENFKFLSGKGAESFAYDKAFLEEGLNQDTLKQMILGLNPQDQNTILAKIKTTNPALASVIEISINRKEKREKREKQKKEVEANPQNGPPNQSSTLNTLINNLMGWFGSQDERGLSGTQGEGVLVGRVGNTINNYGSVTYVMAPDAQSSVAQG